MGSWWGVNLFFSKEEREKERPSERRREREREREREKEKERLRADTAGVGCQQILGVLH